MKEKITTVIRILLSIFMVYLIYKETGIFTAVFAALVTIYIELDSIQSRKQSEVNQELIEIIEKLGK